MQPVAERMNFAFAGAAFGLEKGEEWADSDSYRHTYTRIAGTAVRYRD
jgi:hypothetical protein